MTSSTLTDTAKEIAVLTTRGWVSLNQFAKLADISYPTAQKLFNEEKVHGVRVGGVIRIYAEEVHRFLRDGNAAPLGEASEGEQSPSLPT